MGTKEEFKTIKRWVRYWLENDPDCRNDDKLLIYRIMRCTTNISCSFDDFRRIPSFETIRRVRQKIQESEFFPTSEDVIVRRRLRQDEIRAWAVNNG